MRLVDCVLDQSGEALHRLQLYVHLGAEVCIEPAIEGLCQAFVLALRACVCDTDAFYVFFHLINHADGFRGVLVQNDEAVQVVHSVFKLEGLPWKRVPPNTSLERTRGR